MAGVYKIGVVSRQTGLSPSTLRLWEDQYGLLAPARTRGGTRLYSQSDLERVLYVRHLVRDRGYALDAIADTGVLMGLPELSDDEVRAVIIRLTDLEQAVSGQRRARWNWPSASLPSSTARFRRR